MESTIDNLDEAQRAFDKEVKELLIKAIGVPDTEASYSALSFAFEQICEHWINCGYTISSDEAYYDPDTGEFSAPKLSPNFL